MELGKMKLVDRLISKHNYTKGSAKALIEDFCDIIIDCLEEGHTVKLDNFGKFTLLERKARKCPHPINRGEVCEIPAHWIPRFYASQNMYRAVKLYEDNCKQRGIDI